MPVKRWCFIVWGVLKSYLSGLFEERFFGGMVAGVWGWRHLLGEGITYQGSLDHYYPLLPQFASRIISNFVNLVVEWV
jgi:hypothetical protein